MGVDLALKPKDFTSWVKPFVEDWSEHPKLSIDPENYWWKLYLEILRHSSKEGQNKWVTTFPDLHTGIDGLSAIRGPKRLLIDLLENPEAVKQAMGDMTELFRFVVDKVADIILPKGQGSSNWPRDI